MQRDSSSAATFRGTDVDAARGTAICKQSDVIEPGGRSRRHDDVLAIALECRHERRPVQRWRGCDRIATQSLDNNRATIELPSELLERERLERMVEDPRDSRADVRRPNVEAVGRECDVLFVSKADKCPNECQ